MGNTPSIRIDPSNPANSIVRIAIPTNIVNLAKEVAQQWKIEDVKALEILMSFLGEEISRNGPRQFGSIFMSAYERLIAKDGIPFDGGPSIDISKLHRSARTKSGYTGVYVNGKGFRALGRTSRADPTLRSLGQFPTAERAAWARYQHYKRENMAYGDSEVFIESVRQRLTEALGQPPSEEELMDHVNTAQNVQGKPSLQAGFTADDDTRSAELIKPYGVSLPAGFEP